MADDDTTSRDKPRLAILHEALEIFAHDLSNPLQSLIVLTELALDDATPGSEDEMRCRQSLEAAERMRTLVSGLAGLTRGLEGPRNTQTSVDRFNELLSRRWERHRVELDIALGPAERTPSPPDLDIALLNLGLAAVATAGELGGTFVLQIRGSEIGSGAEPRVALEATLLHRDADGTSAEAPFNERHIQRGRALLAGTGLTTRQEGARVSFEFSPEVIR